jgi:arylsulfatase A-like enzyme
MGRLIEESEPSRPDVPMPEADAPNIVLILLDDVGFGTCGTFGGPVPTPALDRVAANGLRFNQFHTTALCSPTRAAMLTGRNHHAVHMGNIPEGASGFPGYDCIIPKEAATVAEILKQYGYSTGAFGKWHVNNTFFTKACSQTISCAEDATKYTDVFTNHNYPIIGFHFLAKAFPNCFDHCLFTHQAPPFRFAQSDF